MLTDEDIRKIAAVVTREAMHRYSRGGPTDHAEILSDAYLGIAKAIRGYRPGLSDETPYAYLRARGEVLDGIRQRSAVPRTLHARGITREDMPHAIRPLSLDSLAEQTGQPTFPLPWTEHGYQTVDDESFWTSLLSRLNAKERQAVISYYWRDLQMHEIATEMGLTESRISQLLKAARAHLRDKAQEAA